MPSGSVLHRAGEVDRHVELIVCGVVRAVLAAPDGRRMTVRYCRAGALVGVMSLFAADFVLPALIETLTDAEIVRLSPEVVRRCAGAEPQVAVALVQEQSERAMEFLVEAHRNAFCTVAQRIARHLLDLASDSVTADGELVARVSQRELADAAGTVREVTVRVLRELRERGVVRTERDRIVITDLDGLVEAQGWNASR